MDGNKKEKQLKNIADELSRIRPNLVRGDVQDCSEETGIGYISVSNYLSGKGRDPDTGTKILKWFTSLLNERDNNIKNAIP